VLSKKTECYGDSKLKNLLLFQTEEVVDKQQLYYSSFIRFAPENKTEIQQYAFAPFGLGGRKCIATSLALLEVKVAIIKAMVAFRFEKCNDTPELVSPVPQYSVTRAKNSWLMIVVFQLLYNSSTQCILILMDSIRHLAFFIDFRIILRQLRFYLSI